MVRTETGNPVGSEADFDMEFGVEVTLDNGSKVVHCPEDVKIFALVLAEGLGLELSRTGEPCNGYFCLIVGPTGDDSLVFRRLGLVWIDTETMGRHEWQDPSVELPTATLV
jgi:hypothetical protein